MKLNLRKFRLWLLLYVLFDLYIGGHNGGFFALDNMAAAQFTTVTGTVLDPSGIPYAQGTITAALVLTGVTPTLNGGSFSMTGSAGLSNSGSFTMQLADNNVMLPSGLKWQFTVCSGLGTVLPAGGSGPQCFSPAPITITGASQSISAQLQASAVALTLLVPVKFTSPSSFQSAFPITFTNGAQSGITETSFVDNVTSVSGRDIGYTMVRTLAQAGTSTTNVVGQWVSIEGTPGFNQGVVEDQALGITPLGSATFADIEVSVASATPSGSVVVSAKNEGYFSNSTPNTTGTVAANYAYEAATGNQKSGGGLISLDVDYLADAPNQTGPITTHAAFDCAGAHQGVNITTGFCYRDEQQANVDQFGLIHTVTHCAAVGTSANPSLVACSGSNAGSFSCAVAASAATCVISTTAVTANSTILITANSAKGALLGVTCNTVLTFSTSPLLASQVAGTSFTINMPTIATNPACFDYLIFN